MKRLVIFFIAAAQMLATQARQDNAGEPYLSKSFNASEVKTLRSETSGGYIMVTGTNEKESKVEVFVRGNGVNRNLSKEEIQERLADNYNIDVSLNGNELKAVANSRGNTNWKKALSISFKIYVPFNVSSKLNTSGGSITLTNLKGDHDFKTSGGSLKIDQLNGIITGRTSGGSIQAMNSKGSIDMKTSGGSIDAFNCNGKISLSTSGGSLKLNQLKGNIDTRTSGGSIKGSDISGDLYSHTSGGSIQLDQLACSLDAATSAGSVHASFVDPGKTVKVSVSAGSAVLGLPKDKGFNLDLSGGRVNTGTLKDFNGIVDNERVKGSLKGGGTDVYVRTSAGRVSIEWL
ncbi:DUF4097 family beta strand repeat-containing protein [Pararcticibacter amylolyticus]|uniref:Adhesin domain-containing protein n=1 Tax=Pararcticibacter amylolyticus TaxID=2173175 RepID=A0A2U2PFG5_9SPHI|nr:hypothetical protein [Pararcticibacter amylolyticus]PWG80136.1 hypothetical protein DDR33_13120 [Pararcticibacter amylolyticus]